MTSRQLFEYALIEMNKVEASSLLLEDYNYYINKAISQYVNKRYNIYDMNQQVTDDLRVLKATARLVPQLTTNYGTSSLYKATYQVLLPNDYLHLLNCVCSYKVNKQFKCYNQDDVVEFSARRLTADGWSQVINNYYLKPMYKRPYYYIHNVNTSTDLPTNPYNSTTGLGTDMNGVYKVSDTNGTATGDNSNLRRTIKIGDRQESVIERNIANRFGNASSVTMEIRYGKDNSIFELAEIYIDYLKVPQTIRLTQEQYDMTEDTSQVLEFPDYVCQEIVNELVMLLLEVSSDQRLQTQIPISQSVASPIQQEPANNKK